MTSGTYEYLTAIIFSWVPLLTKTWIKDQNCTSTFLCEQMFTKKVLGGWLVKHVLLVYHLDRVFWVQKGVFVHENPTDDY